ncbi:unnamed protein product [Linum tenue]|uniref:Caffeoyl-CoA O-methyltransferase n=1 Tax=Linum tenue TaxID=586396 RepID=A0AAV0GXH3_9ROSI|nr:unnamed protein product [Linum tenue]
MINPKRTIEIGVYTGYSLLATALSTPPDAKAILLFLITAIDPKAEWYEIGLPFIKRAGVEHKIDFIHSPALPVLDYLLLQEEKEGSFDFAFVDADKHNYGNYHDRLMKLVKVGGVIIYDNVLWGGTVANPDGDINLPADKKMITMMAIEFNRRIADDERVEICVAPVGDGLTICRRVS